jgi:uncharacterized protein YyaL (SSP411 family)
VSTKGVSGFAGHFEKMLYDNAQLARVYLHAWQATGEPFCRTIVEEALDYVVREMTFAEGGFYSTQDADSEGEEAKFFIWTPDGARAVLGDQADPFLNPLGFGQWLQALSYALSTPKNIAIVGEPDADDTATFAD